MTSDHHSEETAGRHHSGVTSWGSSWLVTLSDLSESYATQLRSRRRLRVVDLVFSLGEIHARVVDRGGELYPVDIEVRQLSSGERVDVIDAVAGTAGTLAALLDGAIPARLLTTIDEFEIELFPTPSDLRSSCSCEDWIDPCVHTAAVLRELAALIDRDPFTLLELRGLPRQEVVDLARQRRSEGEPADAASAMIEITTEWTQLGRRRPVTTASPDHPRRVPVEDEKRARERAMERATRMLAAMDDTDDSAELF